MYTFFPGVSLHLSNLCDTIKIKIYSRISAFTHVRLVENLHIQFIRFTLPVVVVQVAIAVADLLLDIVVESAAEALDDVQQVRRHKECSQAVVAKQLVSSLSIEM